MSLLLVTATLARRPDWKQWLGEPKVPGNYKKDDAIEKYKQEWYEAAEKNCGEFPLCMRIGTCMIEENGREYVAAEGASKLLSELSSFINHQDVPEKMHVLGLDLRMTLKVAALEVLATTEPIPYWALVYDHPRARFIDPLWALTHNYTTKMSDDVALKISGIPKDLTYASPLAERHQMLKNLSERFLIT